jgi:hypothetical protein
MKVREYLDQLSEEKAMIMELLLTAEKTHLPG